MLDGIPSCRGCGCTDGNACPGGCFWVAPGVCSSCALGLDDGLDDTDGVSGPSFTVADDDRGARLDDDQCPANALGVHQLLWIDTTSGYCVRCGTPVHV